MSATIGLLILTILIACGTAITLAVVPYVRERRRSLERAAFLRAQLLHQLKILPPYLQERNRALALDQRDTLDAFSCLAQQANLLEMDEWGSLLEVNALLATARNRPSYSKREARVAQQLIQHSMTILQSHALALPDRRSWMQVLLGFEPRTQNKPTVDPSLKFRQSAS